jgi:succinate dehydrogenase/fumarate reductase flavoprotein subunit
MPLSGHNDVTIVQVDVVVVGGGSAGSTAAIYAQQALPRGRVLLLEKANIKRSGAIAIGMDGLNNAVIPGHATPEQYVKEITMANDGIVNQRALLAYAENSFAMLAELDRWGVKFQKTETGDFALRFARAVAQRAQGQEATEDCGPALGAMDQLGARVFGLSRR